MTSVMLMCSVCLCVFCLLFRTYHSVHLCRCGHSDSPHSCVQVRQFCSLDSVVCRAVLLTKSLLTWIEAVERSCAVFECFHACVIWSHSMFPPVWHLCYICLSSRWQRNHGDIHQSSTRLPLGSVLSDGSFILHAS